jgi:hypothetical protein
MYVYLRRLSNQESADTTLTPQSERQPRDSSPVHAPETAAIGYPAPVKLNPNDLLLADFEGQDYGPWKTTGTAFGTKPTGPKNRVSGFQGRQLVDTFLINESDQPTGKLISPAFNIERPFINLLVGGGRHPGKTCVNLVVNGKTVHRSVGTAQKDGSKRKIMRWVSWDVAAWKDVKAHLEIIDQASEGWGHIMVDHIFQSDRPVPGADPK